MPPDPIPQRKADHIRINLEHDVRSAQTTGLERYRLVHEALPELNLEQVDTSLTLFGKKLSSPILISSMTGGTEQALLVNRRLAEAAQTCGIAMGVGSQRAALENPSLSPSFAIARQVAPEILLFANLGAVQLNYGYGVDECRRAMEMIAADALILHLNPLQEALQREGNADFRDLARKITTICQQVGVPVIAKEVGWGISAQTAKRLAECGIAAIDVAGAGGTSWSQVEMYRADSEFDRRLAASFAGWGIPTAESILAVKQAVPHLPIFASGGLRDGLDVVKCLALGATLGGMAAPFLAAAVHSTEAVIEKIRLTARQIQVAMFASGSARLSDLTFEKLTLVS